MSGIVGSKFNIRGSGLVGSLGTDGQHMLSAGPGVTNVFETAAGGGKIGQVVSAIQTARITTTSQTAVTTGLAVAITPAATSSKIWLTVNIGSGGDSLENNRSFFTIVGGNAATYKGDAADGHECSACFTSHRADGAQSSANINYLDSPSSTSEVTYTLYFWGDAASTTAMNSAYDVDANSSNTASSITAMEVLA